MIDDPAYAAGAVSSGVSSEPTSHFLSVGRRQLHYCDWGNAAAPALVLIHGGRDHSRSWDWIARQLSSEWHVIAPDLAGHGDSDWLNDGHYDMATFVPDLAELIETLGPAPVSIVGHSLGGMVAFRYTGVYPDRVRRICGIEGLSLSPRLIAAREAPPLDQRFRAWIEGRRHIAARPQRRYATIEAAIERMQRENDFLIPEQAAHLTRYGLRRHEDGGYSWKFDPHLRLTPLYDMPLPQIEQLWTRITCPVLMIYGSESGASDPVEDGRAAFLPHARIVTVEGARHWVHHDHTAEVIDLITPFLR